MLKNGKKVVSIILVLFFLSVAGESQASLQSNPNTSYTKADSAPNWMANIRNMETTGQAMGLSENINGSTLLSTSGSNGIDVHMMKTTEYGAIAILSASGYGNPQTLQASSIKSTTGNKTGVYFSGSQWEYSASCLQGYASTPFGSIDSRYYNQYTSAITSAIAGDSIGNATTANPGCYLWHSAPYANWIPYDSRMCYVHSYGDIFSYSYTYYWSGYFGRGSAVCGSGL